MLPVKIAAKKKKAMKATRKMETWPKGMPAEQPDTTDLSTKHLSVSQTGVCVATFTCLNSHLCEGAFASDLLPNDCCHKAKHGHTP